MPQTETVLQGATLRRTMAQLVKLGMLLTQTLDVIANPSPSTFDVRIWPRFACAYPTVEVLGVPAEPGGAISRPAV